MDEKRIEKFRLKKLRASVDLNTIYQRRTVSGERLAVSGERVYTLEKNMVMDAHILGTKKAEIPILIKATQRVTDLQTEDIQPLRPSQITKRIQREIVEIY